jgi:hypothetical protein
MLREAGPDAKIGNPTSRIVAKLTKAHCEMSRRDGAIVAWHEVPGTAPPQKSRPVGYGMSRARVRTDTMIGVTNLNAKRKKFMFHYC